MGVDVFLDSVKLCLECFVFIFFFVSASPVGNHTNVFNFNFHFGVNYPFKGIEANGFHD